MFGLWLYTVYTTISKFNQHVMYRMEHRILLGVQVHVRVQCTVPGTGTSTVLMYMHVVSYIHRDASRVRLYSTAARAAAGWYAYEICSMWSS